MNSSIWRGTGNQFRRINRYCVPRNAKKTVDIPVNAAIAFYFNQGHSSRSWTELRLFLKQLDFDNCYTQGIFFMMRTKKTHPEIIVKSKEFC